MLTTIRSSPLFLLAPLAALLATGCQDSETGRSTAAEIGRDGGILRIAGATLRIPEDALKYRLRVEMARLESKSVVPPITTQLAGPAFALRPHGTRFDEPATLTLPYQAESDQFVYAARLDNEQDERWEFVPGTGSFPSAREATLEIDGFSVYTIVKTKLEVEFGSGGGGGSGGSGATGATGNGGEAGEVGEYSYDRFCERLCAAQADLDCSADRGEEVCRNGCMSSPPDEDDPCFPESETYRECVWEIIPTAFECGNDGKSQVKNEICTEEQAEVVDCEGL